MATTLRDSRRDPLTVDLATVALQEVPLDATTPDGVGAKHRQSWIMLMPKGEFQHPRYGRLDFSEKTLQEFAQNFNDRVRHIDIALDQNHDGDKATGWLEKVQLRDDGLYALVLWTPLGVQLLADRIYRYFSPEFGDYKDEATGKTYHNVLIGGALTNRPFLKQMSAVALKELRLRDFSKAERQAAAADGDTAGPHGSYPIKTQDDLDNAARLIGHAQNPAAVKAKAKRIAKRRGLKLPDAWMAEEGTASAAEQERYMALDDEDLENTEDLEDDAEDEDDVLDFGPDATDDDEDLDEDLDDEDAEDEDLDESPEGDVPSTLAESAPRGKASAKGAKGKKPVTPAEDEAEDAADGGADEDSEEMADMGDEEYDDAAADASASPSDDSVPPPSPQSAARRPGPMGKGKGKGKAKPTVKMTEEQASRKLAEQAAEIARLKDENAAYKLAEFKAGLNVKLAEMARSIRAEGNDPQFAVPRAFRTQYRDWMLSEGVKLSEDALSGLDEVIASALKLGLVPLTMVASESDRQAHNVVDLDSRRDAPVTPATNSKLADTLTAEAERVALSEQHMGISELALANPAAARAIYLRLEAQRKQRHG